MKMFGDYVVAIDWDTESLNEFAGALGTAGFALHQTSNLNQARLWMDAQACKAVVVERNLRDFSGLQLIKILRSTPETMGLPIVMVSSSANDFDIVEGLESGVDDYVTKPIRALELVRRIQAIMRNRSIRETRPLEKTVPAGIYIDLEGSTAMIDGKVISLTSTEFRLLACFVQAPNRMMSRDLLISKVWSQSDDHQGRKVDVHVKRLRAALRPFNLSESIQTSRGEGYFYQPLAFKN